MFEPATCFCHRIIISVSRDEISDFVPISFVFQAALYAQAADFNKTARFYYMKAQDAYYLANAQVCPLCFRSRMFPLSLNVLFPDICVVL